LNDGSIRKWQGIETLPFLPGALKAKLTAPLKIDLLLH